MLCGLLIFDGVFSQVEGIFLKRYNCEYYKAFDSTLIFDGGFSQVEGIFLNITIANINGTRKFCVKNRLQNFIIANITKHLTTL